MKLIIDIDEETYDEIKKIVINGNEMCFIYKLIANGTPLPKGHGDLIDRNELCGKVHGLKSVCALSDAKAIVKADRCEHPDKCHECDKILTCTYYKENT